jgi:hypothetical protein
MRGGNLIRWVQRDEFWMTNILSMESLREKFDRLSLQKDRGPARKTVTATTEALPDTYIPASEQRRQEIQQRRAAQAGAQ